MASRIRDLYEPPLTTEAVLYECSDLPKLQPTKTSPKYVNALIEQIRATHPRKLEIKIENGRQILEVVHRDGAVEEILLGKEPNTGIDLLGETQGFVPITRDLRPMRYSSDPQPYTTAYPSYPIRREVYGTPEMTYQYKEVDLLDGSTATYYINPGSTTVEIPRPDYDEECTCEVYGACKQKGLKPEVYYYDSPPTIFRGRGLTRYQ